MAAHHPIVEAILKRRSVSPRRLTAPGPDEAQLQLLIEAAAAAPDHGRLHPWRFVILRDSDRQALALAFEQAARELDPDVADAAAAREAEKAHHGPCQIAVIARIYPDHPIAPPAEQWISLGAAIQNVLLAAEALGFRAMIVSGRKVRTAVARRTLGVGEQEELVGFIAVGSYEGELPSANRPPAGDIFRSGLDKAE